jgi:hypothetical protein
MASEHNFHARSVLIFFSGHSLAASGDAKFFEAKYNMNDTSRIGF